MSWIAELQDYRLSHFGQSSLAGLQALSSLVWAGLIDCRIACVPLSGKSSIAGLQALSVVV